MLAVGALGSICAQYKHRAQPATIRYVNVEGEVQVTGVYEASGVRLKKRGYKLALRTNPLQWVSNGRVLASTDTCFESFQCSHGVFARITSRSLG